MTLNVTCYCYLSAIVNKTESHFTMRWMLIPRHRIGSMGIAVRGRRWN